MILPSRIWNRDAAAFPAPLESDPAAVQAVVRNRLGWLDAPTGMMARVDEVQALAADWRRDGIATVYLLGMGGSSLCAEVLRDVPLPRATGVRLEVLDTTDERAIRRATESLEPARAGFLVSSKSGSTIEVTSLERHFWSVMKDHTGDAAGRHFAAITDPGTSLAAHASAQSYRHTFLNPPDIGGRYSALSLFGLVPAALTGVDLPALLESAQQMAAACRTDEAANPGLALGTFMGTHQRAGRDKLTLLVPPALDPFGPWVEQLVAESTGKNGRGILPIVGEPLGKPEEYGRDRAFVVMLTADAADLRQTAARFSEAGHAVFVIETAVVALGAEFFRWEFATAVAGAVIEVNPFDEPNVAEAKKRTKDQLDLRQATGAFRLQPPFERGPGYSRREHTRSGTAEESMAGSYLALLDYLPGDARRAQVIERLRRALRQRKGMASTHGIGPRYLHSTGQYHKGGPNTGVFLLLTAADGSATPVPGSGYTFSTLKQAQALGDFDALAAADRHVIHYHIENPNADFSAELEKVALAFQ